MSFFYKLINSYAIIKILDSYNMYSKGSGLACCQAKK